jgi:hypothetical protein
VLDGEQGGGAAGRGADLRVDVLHVVVRVLGDITSRSATCRVVSPRASRRRTSASRALRPAGSGGRALRRWPAAASTRSTASPSRRPAAPITCVIAFR